MQGRKGVRGVTAVEFALILPVLAVLMFGIIDFGRYFFVQHTLQFATREGTRLALTGRILEGDDSREASIIRTIRDQASTAIDPAELRISIYPVTPRYGDPEGWEEASSAGSPGAFMRVRTRYTYTFLTPFIGDFFTGGMRTIVAEATYRNELF